METSLKYYERKDGKFIVESRFTCERRFTSEDYNTETTEASFYVDRSRDYLPVVNEVYLVGMSIPSYPGDGLNNRPQPILLCREDQEMIEEGWPGNSGTWFRRFHGWRGTTDGWALYGFGVRKCLSVTISGKHSKKIRIVFDRDTMKDQA